MRKSRHTESVRHTILFAIIIGLAAGLAAGPAAADHNSAYTDGAWFVDITHMPDLDQVRAGLPNDGLAYCAPAAAMNLFAYFALHGSGTPPGVANWRSFQGYNTMTGLLAILGQAMDTDPTLGTLGSGAYDGYRSWLPDDRFTILLFQIDEDWAPVHEHVGIYSALYGSYCTLGVGWYTGTGTDITRNSGHAVTVVEAARSGSDRVVGLRDPASSEGLDWRQSSYTTETYSVTTLNRRPTLDGEQLELMQMSRLNGYGFADRTGYIDGLIVVTPQFALGGLVDDGYVIYRSAVIDDGRESTITYAPFEERRICRAVYGSDGRIIFFLCPIDSEDLAEIRIGHPGGEFALVAPAGGTFPALVDAVPAPGRVMFVFDKELGLMEYDTDAMTIDAMRQIPFQTHIDDIAYDEAENGGDAYVWALAVQDSRIIRVDADDIASGSVFTLGIHEAWNLPLGLQIEPITGQYGTFLGWKPGDARVWRLRIEGELLIILAETPMAWPIAALSIDHAGRVLISGDQEIHEFRANGDGVLEPVDDPRFDGLPSAGAVLLSRSWSNYDPDLHVGPAWDHVLPTVFAESVEDCIADFDGDDRVGVLDLLILLASWGTEHPYADIAPDGGDGVVGVDDLIALLVAWGPCD